MSRDTGLLSIDRECDAPSRPGVEAAPPKFPSPALERRVLVLAPTRNDARLTGDFLRLAGIHAVSFPNASTLCRAIEEGCGALLLAEETLNPETTTALSATLDRQPTWSDLPITI